MHVNHIALAVNDLEAAGKRYEALLGCAPTHKETVKGEGVEVLFFKVHSLCIELIAPIDEKSALHSFLEKRGQGLHHIAYGTKDFDAERERLNANGFQQIGDVRKGAKGARVCFFHPRDSCGVLWELVEEGS